MRAARWSLWRRQLLIATLGAAIFALNSSAQADDRAASDLRFAIQLAQEAAGAAAAEGAATLNDVYVPRAYAALWIRDGVATPQAMALVGTLRAAGKYGLRSIDYVDCAGTGRVLCPAADAGVLRQPGVDFELALTRASIRFFRHLHFGRVDPRQAGFDLRFERTPLNYGTLLADLSAARDIQAVIASMEPPFQHYKLLEQALARYRLLESGGAAPTRAELLTAPYDRRIRQIELTLERWRWLPAFNSPPIIVNIPQFRLFAFQSTRDIKAEILQMDVIVGRTYPKLRTPVFAADLKYVIFRPYWDVPYSITQREMLHDIRTKPDFLRRQHLQLVSGPGDAAPVVPASPQSIQDLAAGKLRLRQLPGEDNALGLIKFMLPNSYNVYLHSTPANRLFSRAQRTFSHGCIRVSDPVALATQVLRNAAETWTPQSIVAAMNGKDSYRVNLKTPIRVLILYGTALATEDGTVMFFKDIYRHDRKLEELLGLPALH